MKKNIHIILSTIFAISLIMAIPTFADGINCGDTNIPESVRNAAGCSGNSDSNFRNSIQTILQAVIGVAGLVSVAFIIVGGINYMTSNGDTSKIEKAKKTILYAVIGLIVSALAFVIVNFVIKNILQQ